MTFKLKMRYKKADTPGGVQICFPSFAQSFIQIGFNGIQEVCGVDVMLVQLAAVDTARQNRKVHVSSFIFIATPLMEVKDIILRSLF